MRIGKLEFSTTEFKFKKQKEKDWHSVVLEVSTMVDGRIAMKVPEMSNTIDLNIKHLEELKNWILDIEKKIIVNESFIKFKHRIFSIVPPTQSYLYVICSGITIDPIYVGINHHPEQKANYWGSCDFYEPKVGDIKYIITENLPPHRAVEMENYVIRILRERGFQLLNRTKTGNNPLCEECKSLLYKQEYERYIYQPLSYPTQLDLFNY